MMSEIAMRQVTVPFIVVAGRAPPRDYGRLKTGGGYAAEPRPLLTLSPEQSQSGACSLMLRFAPRWEASGSLTEESS